MGSVGTWIVSDAELSSSILEVDGALISTGSATIEYFVDDGVQLKYLQSDLSTLAAPYATKPCTYSAFTGFGHTLSPVPASTVGQTVHYIIRHSAYGVIGTGSNHVLTAEADGEGSLDVRLVP
jgi:hypothetical protein